MLVTLDPTSLFMIPTSKNTRRHQTLRYRYRYNNVLRASQPLPSVVLGVTNPFFCKALEHWPHAIFIGDPHEGYSNVSSRLIDMYKQKKEQQSEFTETGVEDFA